MKETKQLIQDIFNELSNEYTFLTQWKYTFDNAKRRAGVCKLDSKLISISRYHIKHNSVSTVKDTILHEIAHAIAFELHGDKGHGQCWKMIAQKLGATPRARGKFSLGITPWLLVHSCSKTSNIHVISERFRRNKKIKNYCLNNFAPS